jgi:hypothetical protein
VTASVNQEYYTRETPGCQESQRNLRQNAADSGVK